MSPRTQTREVTRPLNVRELRELSGLSLAELAEKVGISEGMLSYYETGQRTLAAATVERLNKMLTDAFLAKKQTANVPVNGAPLSSVTATFVIGRA